MKKYTLDLLEKVYNEDKEDFIDTYALRNKITLAMYSYTKGNKVIIYNDMAYSLDGFFYKVILEDNTFLNDLNLLELLDGIIEFL